MARRWWWPFAREERATPSLPDALNERRMRSSGRAFGPNDSLQKIAVFAGANLIASTASTMPVDVFTGAGGTRREVEPPPLLIDPGGEDEGLEPWLWEVLFHALIRGNAIGLIGARDRLGFPTLIALQHPDTVVARYDMKTGRPVWTVGGKAVPTEDVWHFKPYPIAGRIMGLSPLGLALRTIGIGLGAEQYASEFYTEGGHPSAILSAEGNLDQKQATAVKEKWRAATSGGREPVVLPKQITYQPIQLAPAEAAALDAMGWTSAECARVFGPGVAEMLGYDTGGSMTYANVEQRSLHLLTFALNPWLVRLERTLSALLPRPQYVKFNRAAILSTSVLDRYKVHEIALRSRITYPNEVRATEDLPPVEWGDEPLPLMGVTEQFVSVDGDQKPDEDDPDQGEEHKP